MTVSVSSSTTSLLPSAVVVPPAREAILLAVNLLPASPHILARLDPMLVHMDASIEDVTEVLRRDAALTARIIRIANSVAFNPGEPLASIEEAVMRIGLAEVYRVTGFAVVSQVANQHIPLYDISGAQFRENSLLTALIMEELAEVAGTDSRAAYTAGLLRSTGKIALDRAIRGTRQNYNLEPYARGPLLDWESATFGSSSGEAAALVLEAWRFPTFIVDAVRDQYLCTENVSPLTRLLNLAAGAAERCGHGLPGEYPYWDVSPEKLIGAGVDEAGLDQATRDALLAFGPVRAAVG